MLKLAKTMRTINYISYNNSALAKVIEKIKEQFISILLQLPAKTHLK